MCAFIVHVQLLLGQVTSSPVCISDTGLCYRDLVVPGRDPLFCLIPDVDSVAPGCPVYICCWSCIPLVPLDLHAP